MSIVPEYLPLKDLAQYSGVSVRRLRDYLHDPAAPLPHYRPAGGKVLVKRAEFDAWMGRFRVEGSAAVDAVVNEILRGVA